MLQRLYANNFRCLVNFEIKLDRLNLLMGVNGCGKSSVFDVLWKIQDFIIGDSLVSEVFPRHEKTIWIDHDFQRFELDVSVDADVYSYKLDIQHDQDTKKSQLAKEELNMNGKPLFASSNGMAFLYKDDHTLYKEFPVNMKRSGIGLLDDHKNSRLLTRFNNEIYKFVVIKPIPMKMERFSDEEASFLYQTMENFPSWYRYISQAEGELAEKLFEELREILPGFRSLKFATLGDNAKLLKASINSPDGRKLDLPFVKLSDGQKMLIALYTLLLFHSNSQDHGYSLFIDEPDNFVALREIQPWLSMLADECGSSIEQAVLISHHPELIDYLGNSHGCWFERDSTNIVRIANAPKRPVDGLSLSETIARGWEA